MLDYAHNQKARKDSLISHGRLAFCSATKILIAFISRAAGSTDTTSRKSAIEEEMFWKVTLSSALIFFCKKYLHNYRIYSINRPGRLLKFWDLESGRLFEVGAYSRLGGY